MTATTSDDPNRQTFLPLLHGAQSYLKAQLKHSAPDSLLAAAWDEFYRIYDDLIRRFVISQGTARSDVDDCVQEVWKEVSARLVTFDRPPDRPGLRAWLYTLVRSKTTNIFRKRQRRRTDSLDEQMSQGREPESGKSCPAEQFEQQWDRALMQSVVADLLQELSPTNARILKMRFFEHFSVDQVARELELTSSVVHARQHRIIKKLRSRVAALTGQSL